MMTQSEVFTSFCKFVDDRIFSKENVGSTVAFVIDQSFINEFCFLNTISEESLMKAVKMKLYTINSRNILHIKGILAIQMFAASKRVKDKSISETNYRVRLSQVLDWELSDLDAWMREYQDIYWDSLYKWCDQNFFEISKCKPKRMAYRYVQYPIYQALRVFSEEDLKYIAAAFVNKRLQPNEDISEKDFWSIVGKFYVSNFFVTSHSRDVRDNNMTDSLYLKQIYQFYLRWNGEYKVADTIKTSRSSEEAFLYLTGDYEKLEFRSARLKLLHDIFINNITYYDIKKIYSFKREGLILFKKDDIYDNYWQETRFLDKGEQGIALVFVGHCSLSIARRFEHVQKRFRKVLVLSIDDTISNKEFYAESRSFSLEGGLKIGRQIYLEGAAPILLIQNNEKFWIDNADPPIQPKEGRINLNYLNVGRHFIKFPNYKRIELVIEQAKAYAPNWLKGYNQWVISAKDRLWNSLPGNKGIVGLDFSNVSQFVESNTNEPILTRWAKIMGGAYPKKKEPNIVLNLLKNINNK